MTIAIKTYNLNKYIEKCTTIHNYDTALKNFVVHCPRLRKSLSLSTPLMGSHKLCKLHFAEDERITIICKYDPLV